MTTEVGYYEPFITSAALPFIDKPLILGCAIPATRYATGCKQTVEWPQPYTAGQEAVPLKMSQLFSKPRRKVYFLTLCPFCAQISVSHDFKHRNKKGENRIILSLAFCAGSREFQRLMDQ